MILTITLNPSVDQALFVDKLLMGDTNRVLRTETDAGGKGINLSRVAVELGARSKAMGFLGGGLGAYIRGALELQGVVHDFIEIKGETRINFSVEDDSHSPPTTFNQQGPSISAGEWDRLVERVRRPARRCRWVAMGGSLPPEAPSDAFRILGDLAKELGCRVVLDADGEALRLGLEAKPDLIKPNTKEAERLLGQPCRTDQQCLAATVRLREEFLEGKNIALISRGAEGAVMACEEGLFMGKSPAVEVRSTIGSGDSLIGGMLAALEQGQTIVDAFRQGLAAGAATAMTDGCEIARGPQVRQLLSSVKVERVTP